jgi:hypothetical protein
LCDKIVDDGEKICENIRTEALKTNLKLELLRERVKQMTWDKMEVQCKAVKSIKGETLLYNYAIRKRTEVETKRLEQILGFRRMELREKITRMEQKLQEILPSEEFSKGDEAYIMNRLSGEQTYEEDLNVSELVIEDKGKGDDAKKAKEKKDKETKVEKGGVKMEGGKRVPTIKIGKNRLGAGKTKNSAADDEKSKTKEKTQQKEEKNIEDLKWLIITKKKQFEDLKRDIENLKVSDLVYDGFEMYTDSRKRQQIEMLKSCIFNLKKQFNIEFTQLVKMKEE